MATQIIVPDIGDDDLPVVELLVKEGDDLKEGDPILVIESDKASMEIPAPSSGVLKNFTISVGDKIKTGQDIGIVEGADSLDSKPTENITKENDSASNNIPLSNKDAAIDIVVPDVGEGSFPIVEVFVSEGESLEEEDPIVMLESDKASMEIPAPTSGTLKKITKKIGDNVSTGDVIGQILTKTSVTSPAPAKEKVGENQDIPKKEEKVAEEKEQLKEAPKTTNFNEKGFSEVYASPSVRKLARELGADLSKVLGTGRKERITHDDVKNLVKSILTGQVKSQIMSSGIPEIPTIDFSKFGETETVELNRIKLLTGENLSRAWLNVPHVTQFDEADITDLEVFRKSLKQEAEKKGVRVTMLAFLMKAIVAGMQEFPRFNSSLASDKKSLILKKYYNIGIAVDTPAGLVVPVIKDVDKKGIFELSEDLMTLSQKARDKKLSPGDMQGSCMTISSLGGIGGTAFTPIVNAPEVAILGVSRSKMQPVWDGSGFVPRNILPLSLSYDHRVIDGAEGAKFTQYLAKILLDTRRLIL